MIIATFNANSLRSRLPIILKWLAEHRPDVLCVQETKVQDNDFPKEAFAGSGYQFVFKGEKRKDKNIMENSKLESQRTAVFWPKMRTNR